MPCLSTSDIDDLDKNYNDSSAHKASAGDITSSTDVVCDTNTTSQPADNTLFTSDS